MIGRADFLLSLAGATALHAAALGLWGPDLGGGGAGADGAQRITVAAASASLQSLVAVWERPPDAAAAPAPVRSDPDLPRPDAGIATGATDRPPAGGVTPTLAEAVPIGAAPAIATVAAMTPPQAAPSPVPPPNDASRPLVAAAAPRLPQVFSDTLVATPAPPDAALAQTPRPDPRPTRAAVTRRVAAGVGHGLSAGQAATDATRKTDAAARAAAEAQWAALIQSKIARHQAYPRGARQAGRVQVSMVILRNGSLGEVRVARSSGAQRLDQAAVHAVRRAAPFPPAPDALDDDWFRVGQWITFDRR